MIAEESGMIIGTIIGLFLVWSIYGAPSFCLNYMDRWVKCPRPWRKIVFILPFGPIAWIIGIALSPWRSLAMSPWRFLWDFYLERKRDFGDWIHSFLKGQ